MDAGMHHQPRRLYRFPSGREVQIGQEVEEEVTLVDQEAVGETKAIREAVQLTLKWEE